MLETLKQWDRDLFIYLNSIGIDKYDGFWLFITDIRSWIPLYIFFTVLIFYYYRRQKAQTVLLYLVLVVVLTLSITSFVKEYVARLRPSEVEAWAELIRVLQKPSRYSFFSGHASFSFSVTTFVVLALRSYTKWIYFAFLWPIVLMLSRIYVGVHYPGDIIAGAFVGSAIAVAGYFQCKKALNRQYGLDQSKPSNSLNHSGNGESVTNGQ